MGINPVLSELFEKYPSVAEAFADWTPETVERIAKGEPDRTDLMVSTDLIDFETVPTIWRIQKVVARLAGIEVRDLLSDRRAAEFSRPRMIAMALCAKHTRHSLQRIAQDFGDRDHTTVMHARRRTDELRHCNDDFAFLWRACKRELGFHD